MPGAFWDDVAKDAQDPEYAAEATHVHGIDALVSAPNEATVSEDAIADYKERLRRKRIEDRRKGMEELHAELLKERGGKVYTTEETLGLIDELRMP